MEKNDPFSEEIGGRKVKPGREREAKELHSEAISEHEKWERERENGTINESEVQRKLEDFSHKLDDIMEPMSQPEGE